MRCGSRGEGFAGALQRRGRLRPSFIEVAVAEWPRSRRGETLKWASMDESPDGPDEPAAARLCDAKDSWPATQCEHVEAARQSYLSQSVINWFSPCFARKTRLWSAITQCSVMKGCARWSTDPRRPGCRRCRRVISPGPCLVHDADVCYRRSPSESRFMVGRTGNETAAGTRKE
jgi:hypothetical protein